MTALVCQMPENQRIHIKDLREKKNQTYAKNISDLRIPVPPSIAIYISVRLYLQNSTPRAIITCIRVTRPKCSQQKTFTP